MIFSTTMNAMAKYKPTFSVKKFMFFRIRIGIIRTKYYLIEIEILKIIFQSSWHKRYFLMNWCSLIEVSRVWEKVAIENWMLFQYVNSFVLPPFCRQTKLLWHVSANKSVFGLSITARLRMLESHSSYEAFFLENKKTQTK